MNGSDNWQILLVSTSRPLLTQSILKRRKRRKRKRLGILRLLTTYNYLFYNSINNKRLKYELPLCRGLSSKVRNKLESTSEECIQHSTKHYLFGLDLFVLTGVLYKIISLQLRYLLVVFYLVGHIYYVLIRIAAIFSLQSKKEKSVQVESGAPPMSEGEEEKRKVPKKLSNFDIVNNLDDRMVDAVSINKLILCIIAGDFIVLCTCIARLR